MAGYDRDADRAILRDAILPHVPFDGWSARALAVGAQDAGLATPRLLNAFPGGPAEVLAFTHETLDQRMREALDGYDVASLRLRERIALAVRLRLTAATAEREAIRAGITFLLLPQNVPLGARLLYRTVDAIWYAAGDKATDFSFYSKRAILAGVYAATVFYWLNDRSPSFSATWAFLDRRLDEVMKIPVLKQSLRRFVEKLPVPRLLRRHGPRHPGLRTLRR